MIKQIIGISLGLLLMCGLGWIVAGNNLAMMSFFAPKFEQVRRETHHS